MNEEIKPDINLKHKKFLEQNDLLWQFMYPALDSQRNRVLDCIDKFRELGFQSNNYYDIRVKSFYMDLSPKLAPDIYNFCTYIFEFYAALLYSGQLKKERLARKFEPAVLAITKALKEYRLYNDLPEFDSRHYQEERVQSRQGASDIWGVEHSFYKALMLRHEKRLITRVR